MTTLLSRALQGNSRAVPVELRSNFHHLYRDILWYSVLSGSAISFLTVYATRTSVGERFLTRSRGESLLRLEVLSGPFGVVVAGLFLFHLALNAAILLGSLAGPLMAEWVGLSAALLLAAAARAAAGLFMWRKG